MSKYDINLLFNQEPRHAIPYLMFVILFPQLDFNFLDDRRCTLTVLKMPTSLGGDLCIWGSIQLDSHTKCLGKSWPGLRLGRKKSRHGSLLCWRSLWAMGSSEFLVFWFARLLRKGRSRDFSLEKSRNCIWSHLPSGLDISIPHKVRRATPLSARDKTKPRQTQQGWDVRCRIVVIYLLLLIAEYFPSILEGQK